MSFRMQSSARASSSALLDGFIHFYGVIISTIQPKCFTFALQLRNLVKTLPEHFAQWIVWIIQKNHFRFWGNHLFKGFHIKAPVICSVSFTFRHQGNKFRRCTSIFTHWRVAIKKWLHNNGLITGIQKSFQKRSISGLTIG